MLAGHLGVSVHEAQQRISSKEFAEWQAYHSHIEPIGDKRTDLLFAMLMHVVASCHSGKKSRFSVQDFIPEWMQKSQAENAQDVAERLSSVLGRMAQKGDDGDR